MTNKTIRQCKSCGLFTVLEDNDFCHTCNWDLPNPDQKLGDMLDDQRVLEENEHEE